MFTQTLKTILAVGVIATGATFSTTNANAGDVGIYFNGGHGGFYVGNGHKRPRYDYGHGYNRRGYCKPRRALKKAWRMGVNRPHITRIGRNRIVVKGFNHGHRAKVVFSRSGHRCPVIKAKGIY